MDARLGLAWFSLIWMLLAHMDTNLAWLPDERTDWLRFYTITSWRRPIICQLKFESFVCVLNYISFHHTFNWNCWSLLLWMTKKEKNTLTKITEKTLNPSIICQILCDTIVLYWIMSKRSPVKPNSFVLPKTKVSSFCDFWPEFLTAYGRLRTYCYTPSVFRKEERERVL